MLIAITAGLAILCLILTAMVIRLFQILEANRRQFDNPEDFSLLFLPMFSPLNKGKT